MQIHGFNKLTLLDYPGHLAATIFLGSCNMRCPFCQNASLVNDPASQPVISSKEVLSVLARRKNVLEGVCISGGEPTLSPELPDFIRSLKELGYFVKLDTNGTKPDIIKYLYQEKLIDYVAMDVKNSKAKYSMTAGITDLNLKQIEESISFLLSSTLTYEFRTTVVRELHTAQDMLSIGEWIRGAKAYYLQDYKDSDDILVPGLSSHSKETLNGFVDLLVPFVEQVSLRGVE